jgi:L-cysteine S-thiosulfotransferase
VRPALAAGAAAAALAGLLGSAGEAQAPGRIIAPANVEIVGDGVPRSLTGRPGDPARGAEIALAREQGNCLACHVIPAPDAAAHGNVGPPLGDVADRLSEAQIRLRLVDMRRLNPTSIMPSYYRVDGLRRVAAAYAGKPVLTAAEIEDVVAFLATLGGTRREPGQQQGK